MQCFARLLSNLFGLLFLALSFLVAAETLLRKLFNVSLQGADELGGYALAVGSGLAFSIALIGRAHIRIDLVHRHLPSPLQGVMNWLAIVLMALFAGLLARVCYMVVVDTMAYKSTAATPWATPLIYPQGVWYGALLIFALIAFGLALRASWLLVRGRLERLNDEFQPRGVTEELREEIEDLVRR